MIEGVNAYLGSIYTSRTKISSDYQTTFGGELTTGGTVEDVVTLSAAAQEVLKSQADSIPLNATENPIRSGTTSTNTIAAELEGRNLAGTDLTGIALNFANLKDANFNNTVLREASLAYADATGATFHGADLRGANFSNVSGLTADALAGARVNISTVLPIAVVQDRESIAEAGEAGLLWARGITY